MDHWSCNPLPHRQVAGEGWIWFGSKFHARQGGKAHQIGFICSEHLQCAKELKVVDCIPTRVCQHGLVKREGTLQCDLPM